MLQIIKYEAGVALNLKPLNYYIGTTAESVDKLFQAIEAYTLVFDGEPLVLGGFNSYWQGVAEIHLFVAENYINHQKTADVLLGSFIQRYCRERSIRKVYSIIDSSRVKHIYWAERFGFNFEFKMVAAGPECQDLLGYSYNY